MSVGDLVARHPAPEEWIDARGVRVHNLKGIDVRIPLRKLVVLTGVSGSGKSSLAFDTLYAEGQRRYVESLSAYARQFLERLDRPDVDEIEGICPAIALRQRPPGRNPRSTVATATEIHDHLRLLFAHAGATSCGACGGPVGRDSAEAVADRLAGHGDARLLVAFPVGGGGTREEAVATLLRRGFRRAVGPGGEVVVLDEAPPEVVAGLEEPLLAVADRVSASAGRSRLVDSIETAFREGGGRATIHVAGGPVLRVSDAFACLDCGQPAEPPSPRLFSFNHAEGACPSCHGFGNLIQIDEALVVPDPRRTLEGGAVEPWTRPRHRAVQAELLRFARRRSIPLDVPWRDLAEEHRRLVLEGDEEFPGVIGFFRRLESRKYQVQVRVFLSRYRGYRTCPACGGARLRPESLRVRVAGRTIAEVSALTVESALAFLQSVTLAGPEAQAAGRVLADLERRMRLLSEVGLDYLTLDRPFGTLSGGEAQRVALATALGTGLVGTLYVLDEPSVGLHPRDTGRLIGVLRALRDQGSSVLVVEHERSVMAVADHVIDLGPGAGEQGGRVVFEGTYEQLLRDGRSLTAKYLRGELTLPAPPPPTRRRKKLGPAVVVRGARARNLRGVTARFPLGALTCVTGVSGSGKSTLVHDVMCAAILHRLGRWDRPVGEHEAVEGAAGLRDVVLVDQSPVGRTPRSNPVTYVKAFDAIRELYATTREARQRGLSAGDFSFNVPGGRCEACAGDGQVRVDMQFLADVALLCETCGGRRYRPPVLEVRWRGRTIDQVLEMTVHEALHFFAGQAAVARRLKLLEAIGLGYLRLGQSATSLSGGEAQRLKLAVHLSRRDVDRTLFVLDEPTSGLHMADVAELMKALERLLERGATLVVIEHDMDVVARAEWVVDLGPGGGDHGGALLYEGPPEGLAQHASSPTAPFLRAALGRLPGLPARPVLL